MRLETVDIDNIALPGRASRSGTLTTASGPPLVRCNATLQTLHWQALPGFMTAF
jgi:hypothetical protein